jgi:hypothetical protein
MMPIDNKIAEVLNLSITVVEVEPKAIQQSKIISHTKIDKLISPIPKITDRSIMKKESEIYRKIK